MALRWPLCYESREATSAADMLHENRVEHSTLAARSAENPILSVETTSCKVFMSFARRFESVVACSGILLDDKFTGNADSILYSSFEQSNDLQFHDVPMFSYSIN